MLTPPAIITAIASSEYFTLSTGGSAYLYPIILNSNGASLSSESNADGNGSTFGHFYKRLLSSSASLIVSNVSSLISVCNFRGDSTATVSLWTSTGKYLQVPLVGHTYTTIRKDMIAKGGVILNTVSTNNAYSTIVSYGSSAPSDFILKEGTYSTPMTGTSMYNFSFADICYLNMQNTGVDILLSTDTTNLNASDSVTLTYKNWNVSDPTHISTLTLNSTNSNAKITTCGDIIVSNALTSNWGVYLNLCMCNLAPSQYYRLQTIEEISTHAICNGLGITTASQRGFDCLSFPGTIMDYLSISTNFATLASGSICFLTEYESPSGQQTCNILTMSNQGNTANALKYNIFSDASRSSNHGIFQTFGSAVISRLPDYNNTLWNLTTITFSNYTQKNVNYYDVFSYNNTLLVSCNYSNSGHTSSFMGGQLIVGCNYPGYLMNLAIFDRCLCKREIELYLDIVQIISNSSTICGTSIDTGGGGGTGSSNYYYTGSSQSFSVPSGVTTITITMSGGSGQSAMYSVGGEGGLVQGTLTVSYGQSYQIIVGGGGNNSSTYANIYPGGGYGSIYWCPSYGGNGGGYSAILDMTSAIIAIAGAGGGGALYANGGNGGGSTANSGDTIYGAYILAGGGSQTAGGDAGDDGLGGIGNAGYYLLGGNSSSSGYGGGGGGGYYGGGGGGTYHMSAGGGSSYVGGLASVATNSVGGGASGGSDGYITITW